MSQPSVCLFLKLTLFVLKGVFLSCLFFLSLRMTSSSSHSAILLHLLSCWHFHAGFANIFQTFSNSLTFVVDRTHWQKVMMSLQHSRRKWKRLFLQPAIMFIWDYLLWGSELVLSYCCGTFKYNRLGTLQEVAKVHQIFTTGLVPKRKSESSLTRTTEQVNKTLSPWLICPDVKSCDLAGAF